MSDTIIFRGAYIRRVELRNGEDGRHVRIEFTADWSKPVREHMGWGDVGEGIGACDLVGELVGSAMTLTPSKRELAPLAVEVEVSQVSSFNVVPVKDAEGEPTNRELRFTVKTGALDAAKKIEQYVHAIGRGVAQLNISYVKQEELPLERAADAGSGD
jgi:hypothetical protein